MAKIQEVGSDNAVGATTMACTIVSSTAGSLLTVIVGAHGTDVTGVTDNLGQTYIKAFVGGAFTEHPSIWYFPNSSAGVVLITVTFSVSRASAMIVAEDSGMATSSTYDVSAQSGSASAAVWDSGATGNTSAANNLAFNIACSASGSNRAFDGAVAWTDAAGTGITAGHHGNTTDGNDLYVGRQVIASITTVQGTGTCTAATLVTGTVVVFKVAGGGGGSGQQNRLLLGVG